MLKEPDNLQKERKLIRGILERGSREELQRLYVLEHDREIASEVRAIITEERGRFDAANRTLGGVLGNIPEDPSGKIPPKPNLDIYDSD